jgi:endogenous inhibitor of DNA gyrase (YacG/DUF329 family)
MALRSKNPDRAIAMIHRCPICRTSTDSDVHKDFPFCSERCRMQDLGNWATEKYVVSDPIFDEEEIEKADGERKTIILDLDETDDSER